MNAKRFAFKNRIISSGISVLLVITLFYAAFNTPQYKLTQIWFNPYALLSGFTVLIGLVLFIYMMRKPARTDERIWLNMYLAAIVVFAFSEMMQRLSAAPIANGFWSTISSMAVVVPPIIYLFTLAYTNQGEEKYPTTTAIVLFAGILMLVFEVATNIVFNNAGASKYIVLAPWGWDLRAAVGPYVTLLPIWYYVLLGAAIVRLLGFRRHTSNPILRKQSLLFALAVSIPLFGGAMSDLVLPEFGINILPLPATLAAVAAAIIIYGLVRYQLLTVSPTLFSNTVLSIMQESVVVTDAKFNVVFVNQEAENLLGVKTDERSKTTALDLIEPGSLAKFQQAFADTAATGTVNIDHIDMKRAHGSSVPMKVRSSRLQLADYSVYVMALTDITEELHTQSIIEHEVQVRTEQLNKARAYLVSSINSLQQGFILVNAKAGVELTNQVAAKLFGMKADDAPSHPLGGVVAAKKWDADLAATVDKVLENKQHKTYDAAAKDGSFYRIFVTPILAGERELGATIIIEDTTEQKILERSKDEFFSIASHELRTPLTAIRGNSGMVKEYYPDAMKDPSLATMIDDIHDASVRLIEIVNDFLDSSRLEQGKMEFDIKPIALAGVVEAVQKDLQYMAKQAHVTLRLEGLNVLPAVMADEARVRQIIYNLMSNAIKYGVENETVTASGEADAHSAKIRVTDTGKGISPENQKLLFHKFQQAGDSILTRDNTKGTGLGLYISRLLAEGMSGTVELEHTEVGKGTTFVLTLPISKK